MKYCGVQYSIDYPAWKKQIKRLLPKQKQRIKFHPGRQNSEIGAYSPKDKVLVAMLISEMGRIRYVKPDFFKDEDVAELPDKTKLLYIGLWCFADKSGRIEDRPKRKVGYRA
ncbi:MAG TPA: hypothetical protein DCL42_10415 [Deltaproteobacteria bacterium]|nr:hypothetical protein [Deltaproteobacteria bacterium]